MRRDRIFAGRKTDRLIGVSRARAFAGEEGDKADTADDVALVGSGLIASNYFNELLATAPLTGRRQDLDIITG